MNRRDVNNAVVGLAGVLAQTNQEADAEVGALQVEVQQLRAALDQHRAVTKAARAYVAAVERVAEPREGGGMQGTVDIALFTELEKALSYCP